MNACELSAKMKLFFHNRYDRAYILVLYRFQKDEKIRYTLVATCYMLIAVVEAKLSSSRCGGRTHNHPRLLFFVWRFDIGK